MVRITDIKRGPAWTPPRVNPNASSSYVWYFASVSGVEKGMRWTADGCLPPGTTFTLHIVLRRQPPAPSATLFRQSLESFLRFGAIGLRVTRGLGSFTCAEHPVSPDQLSALTAPLSASGFIFQHREDKSFASWLDALNAWSAFLKFQLRRERKSTRPSPLGTSDPRQTSAV